LLLCVQVEMTNTLTMVDIGYQILCEELQKIPCETRVSLLLPCALGVYVTNLDTVSRLYSSNLWNISYNCIGTKMVGFHLPELQTTM